MFKSPSAKQIKILQDIKLRKPQDDSDQFRKKPRLTSSVIMLEEEPLFSDSDEERESTKILFGTILPAPVNDKFRDAEVQCDLLKPEKTLYELINQCSKLNAEYAGNFKGIIKSCEKFIARQSFHRNEADELSDISYITKKDYACSPSRKKKTSVIAKPNNELKRGLVSRNESRNISVNRRISKRIQTKSERNGPFSSTQIFDGTSSTFKKPFDVDIGDVLEANRSVKKSKEIQSLARNWMKPHKSLGYVDDDLESTSHSESLQSKNCSPKNLSSKEVKSLAKNWMKQHKSLCYLEDDLESRPHFASLQPTKVRRLYSPSHWLLSQDFLNSGSTTNSKPCVTESSLVR